MVEQSDPADEIDRLLSELRARLNKFLVTRSVNTGLIKKTKSWSLTKTNPGLFKLESDRVSVLISTEPFLIRKDGKIAGLLGMSETDLCRAVSSGKNEAEFFHKSYPVRGNSVSLMHEITRLDAGNTETSCSISDLESWAPFELHQMIAKNRPNTVAHVLIHAPEAVVDVLLNAMSVRYKRMLLTELQALLSPGSTPEMNPMSKNYGLLEFEQAIESFEQEMENWLKREKLRQRNMEKVAV